MIGFAVPAAFVTFAWWDTVYYMAALLSGLYVSTRAQIDAVAIEGATRQADTFSSDALPGWRVRQSAWRSSIRAAASPTR
jgi:hypothetical protein